MESRGHTVVAKIIHGESDGSLEMVVNRALFAAVRVEYLFIKECAVAALGDILVNRREQPKSVVRAVAGVTRFLYIFGVVGGVFLTRLVSIFYKRQTRAVRNLCGEHELYLLFRHLGSKVDNTLDILDRITVAESVSQTAVLEGSGSRPDKGYEAVVCVPCVHHVVEVCVGGVYLEVVQLAVPVFLKLRKLLFNHARFIVFRYYLLGNIFGLLTEKVGELLCFPGLKNDIALQRSA